MSVCLVGLSSVRCLQFPSPTDVRLDVGRPRPYLHRFCTRGPTLVSEGGPLAFPLGIPSASDFPSVRTPSRGRLHSDRKPTSPAHTIPGIASGIPTLATTLKVLA